MVWKNSVINIMNKITTIQLKKMKQAGEKFACLTAYDASFAIAQENAGIEVILVGDSLGMVVKVNPAPCQFL